LAEDLGGMQRHVYRSALDRSDLDVEGRLVVPRKVGIDGSGVVAIDLGRRDYGDGIDRIQERISSTAGTSWGLFSHGHLT
jgi:hypothetical protein